MMNYTIKRSFELDADGITVEVEFTYDVYPGDSDVDLGASVTIERAEILGVKPLGEKEKMLSLDELTALAETRLDGIRERVENDRDEMADFALASEL